MKKILVLGAGVYQLPLIRAVQRMGYRSLVLSVVGPYPGIEVADVFFPVNVVDVEEVKELARREGVDAVMTVGSDVAVPSIGAVVDELGIPGTGYEASLRSMNKVLMKKALKEGGVPGADFEVVRTLEGARSALDKIGLPAMVKAVDSSGSRGVTRIDKLSSLESAWEDARTASRSDDIIIEECLDGLEFGAQAFVQGGDVISVFLHNDTVTGFSKSTPIGHSMPISLSQEVARTTEEIVKKAIDVLDIRDTCSNVDLMLVNEKPYIIEVGARIGATCLPENIGFYYGFDVYEFLIRTALGERVELRPVQEQANASLLLTSKDSGVLKNVLISDEVRDHPNLLELRIDVIPGDQVSEFRVGPDRLGHIMVSEQDAKKAERLASYLASQVEFILEQVE